MFSSVVPTPSKNKLDFLKRTPAPNPDRKKKSFGDSFSSLFLLQERLSTHVSKEHADLSCQDVKLEVHSCPKNLSKGTKTVDTSAAFVKKSVKENDEKTKSNYCKQRELQALDIKTEGFKNTSTPQHDLQKKVPNSSKVLLESPNLFTNEPKPNISASNCEPAFPKQKSNIMKSTESNEPRKKTTGENFDSDSSSDTSMGVFNLSNSFVEFNSSLSKNLNNKHHYENNTSNSGTLKFTVEQDQKESSSSSKLQKKALFVCISSDEETCIYNKPTKQIIATKITNADVDFIDQNELSPLEDFVDIRNDPNNKIYLEQFQRTPKKRAISAKNNSTLSTNPTSKKSYYKKSSNFQNGKKFFRGKNNKKANYTKTRKAKGGNPTYNNNSMGLGPDMNSTNSGTENRTRMSLTYNKSKKMGAVIEEGKRTGLFDISAKVELPAYNFYKVQPYLDAANEMQWEGVGSKKYN
ncbi:hypothetical protein BB561_001960 [Smittium simulii]|uniref:Uncharacterized protein n=1 Tax=Smittium simulii TaxID=133385 RepID=A0A2T9YSB5_9FUNG|nr:hypothetical protein BB561_001960 [Smittium simulii]